MSEISEMSDLSDVSDWNRNHLAGIVIESSCEKVDGRDELEREVVTRESSTSPANGEPELM